MSPLPAPSALPRHLPGLDVLRALAALAVLLCHALSAVTLWSPAWRSQHPDAALHTWLGLFNASLGAGGVGLFFVLSGLCIHLPVASAMAQGAAPQVALRPYLKRRFRRIYPPHLVALLASIGLAALLPLASEGVHPMVSTVSWGQLLAHLALVHTFFPSAFYSGNHVLWSIAVEAHFYLLFPLVLLARRRLPMARVCLLLLVGAVALKLAGKGLLEEEAKALLAQSFLCRLWEWTLGCWVAERLVSGRPAHAVRLGELVGLLALVLVAGMAMALLPYGALLRSVVWPLLFAGLIARGARMHLAPGALLASIGRASYSLYLVHPLALSATLFALRRWATAEPGQELLFGMAASGLLAAAFHRWVERPFLAAAQPGPAVHPHAPGV